MKAFEEVGSGLCSERKMGSGLCFSWIESERRFGEPGRALWLKAKSAIDLVSQ
jgi:hypothetical protein